MKLTTRVKEFSKKVTLMSTAFVLAVSTLAAAVPFIAAEQVSAVNPNCETEFSATHQVCVNTLAELNAAIGDTAKSEIIINNTIETAVPILITRPLMLNGHDEKIVLTGDTTGWQGNFVVKVFNTTGVRINSLQTEGGDAGLQVNNSEVSISGNMRFINHEFGNIELGKSSNASLTRAPKLTVASQGTLAGDNNTTVNKPYVWVANNAVNDAVVSDLLHRGLNRTTNSANFAQHWYFANPDLTGVAATVVETGDVFATPQEAITAATTGQTVQLQKDIEIGDTAIRVNKDITLDGNNMTITAPTVKGSSANNKNAAIVVSATGASVENVTITSTYASNPKHGIVVQGNSAISGVSLSNITTNGTSAGFILNNSGVTAKDISTNGSLWYGINVAGTATLDISGENSHDSNVYAIYAENESNVSIAASSQYVRIAHPVDNENLSTDVAYVLKSAVPVASVSVNGKDTNVVANDKTDVIKVEGVATGDNAPKYHYFMISAPGQTNLIAHIVTTTDSNVSFNLRDVAGIPLEGGNGNKRVKAGNYGIRYVVFDSNNIRNDAVVSETINLTVDNTAPTASVELSDNFIVSNNALPTITVDGTDASGISKVEYKIVLAGDTDTTVVSWTEIQNNASTPLNTLSALPNGEYAIAVAVWDNADNRYRHAVIEFTIDRTISTTVSVSSLQSPTPTLNGTALYANNAPAANEVLTVTVDGESYPVTTSTTGAWELPLTGVAAGNHDVIVAHAGAGTIVTTNFTTTLATINNEDPTTEEEEEEVATATTTTSGAQFPFAFAQSGVLGDSDQANDDDASNTGTAEINGASDILAQAVDADNTNGEALGLSWYWWLLIVAGGAALVWWIVAMIRGRNAQA